ncbi:unnamed protein product [Ectocarpus fasciculatus]
MGLLFVYRPTRELKGCLTLAAVLLPLAGSFAPMGGAMPALRLRSLGRRSSAGACPHTSAYTRCAAAATLFSAEEAAALEQQGAGHLPSWDLMPFRETFDQLHGELTSPVFSDGAWENSQEYLKSIVVELASCVLPFSEDPYLPLQHAAALLLVARLSERARGARPGEEGAPVDMYSSLKYSTKKNGVARAAAQVAQGLVPKFESSYEKLVVIRGVERCLAEFSLVWSTARLLETCAPPETKRDFLFHLRPLLEHAPARDRHESVLVLCRGLFTPGHNKEPSRVHDNVHGVALRQEHGGYPLEEAFSEVQRGAVETPGGLRAARQAYPFLEMLTRWAWRCKLSEEEEAFAGKRKKSVTKSFGKKSKKKMREAEAAAAAAAGRGEEEVMAGGKENGGEAAATADGGRSREDTGVASLLVELAKADPSGATIRSMQRWACEAILPEQVRLNRFVAAVHFLFSGNRWREALSARTRSSSPGRRSSGSAGPRPAGRWVR